MTSASRFDDETDQPLIPDADLLRKDDDVGRVSPVVVM
jgi:hypothetical protein